MRRHLAELLETCHTRTEKIDGAPRQVERDLRRAPLRMTSALNDQLKRWIAIGEDLKHAEPCMIMLKPDGCGTLRDPSTANGRGQCIFLLKAAQAPWLYSTSMQTTTAA
jgi:hypothetical protein